MGLTTVIIMSVISKTQMVIEAKSKIKQGKDIRSAYIDAIAESKGRTTLTNIAILFGFLTITIATGTFMLPATLAVGIGAIVIELSNTFIQPTLMINVEEFHLVKTEEAHKKAILQSQAVDVIEEELLKEVNY